MTAQRRNGARVENEVLFSIARGQISASGEQVTLQIGIAPGITRPPGLAIELAYDGVPMRSLVISHHDLTFVEQAIAEIRRRTRQNKRPHERSS